MKKIIENIGQKITKDTIPPRECETFDFVEEFNNRPSKNKNISSDIYQMVIEKLNKISNLNIKIIPSNLSSYKKHRILLLQKIEEISKVKIEFELLLGYNDYLELREQAIIDHSLTELNKKFKDILMVKESLGLIIVSMNSEVTRLDTEIEHSELIQRLHEDDRKRGIRHRYE
jgi:hypothetical protein